MKTIEYGEHCFGTFVEIDGEDLHLHEYDERGEEYIKQLKLKLINELVNMVDVLSSYELKQIAEIVTQNNSKWECDQDRSRSGESCDQCGNWNYKETYNKNILITPKEMPQSEIDRIRIPKL
jgi:hypothetical protein